MDSRTLLGLAVLLVLNQHIRAASNICERPKCVQEAEKIIHYVDTNANPCEDFYKFSCGNFVANSLEKDKIEPDRRLTEHDIGDVQLLYQEHVHENDHKMVKLAKMLYSGCMKEMEIKNDFIETVKQTFKQIGGWPVLEGSSWNDKDFDWLNATYKLRRLGYDYFALFDVTVANDKENEIKRILKVEQGPRRYLFEDDIQYLPKVAVYLGAENEEEATKELNDVYEFLQKHKELDLGDYVRYVRQTVEEYQKGEDTINWLEFINIVVGPKFQISKNDNILFPNKKYLKRYKEFLSNTPKRTLANYMMWQLLKPLLPFLTNCSTSPEMCWPPEERNIFCLKQIHHEQVAGIPNPIDVLRLRRYLSDEKRKSIENMVLKINSEFIEVVNKIKWIPESIKQKVIDKVKNTTVVVGLPRNYFDDNMLDESDIDVGDVEESSSFFTLLAQARRNFKAVFYWAASTTSFENDYGAYLTQRSLPTYYKNNVLYIPIDATKYFFYDEIRPEYLNYGRLGTQVGAALGELLLSLVEEKRGTREAFTKIEDCLVLKLNNYTIDDYIKEDTWHGVFENIIGQHVSYAVYQELMKANTEEPKLVATNYTPNQLFWISAASLKCAPPEALKFQNPKFLQNKIKSTMYIVSESMRQNPNLAKDFNCSAHSGLNTAETCEVV